jgi:ABC-type multidrug transport system fused ATPase/permease subunit
MRRRDALSPQRLTIDPFWAFARALLRDRAQIALTLVMVVVSGLTLGAGIIGAKPILDNVLGARKDLPTLLTEANAAFASRSFPIRIPQSWIDAAPAGDPFAALVWVMGALSILTIIGALANFAHAYLSLTIVNRLVTSVRRRAFQSLLRAPHREVLRITTGDAVSRIVKDSDTLANGLNVLLSKTLLQGVKGIAGLSAAMWFDWRVTSVALLAGPGLYTIIRKLGKRIRRASGAAMEGQSKMLASASESLQSLRVVKAYDADRYEAGRFHQLNKAVFKQLNRVRTARAVASPLTEALSIFLLCGMVLAAGRAILSSHVEPTNFILAIVALAVAGAALKPVTALAHDIQTSRPAADRLRELILLKPEPGHQKRLPRLSRHTRSIELRNVTLTYPGRDVPALRDLSLTILAGQRVAFVGPNGCGKTTLLSLVPRLLDPDAGQVLIDSVDIASINVRSLRAQVGMVSQEAVLFRGTIKSNIAYGTWPSDDRIIDAAQRARAHDFIMALPQGYETPVAEQGQNLSGGQRQRIAIARAILRDPAILILDEATSMVDSESEAHITSAIDEFSKGRTTLVVAHRLSTVTTCDRIIVMDAGRIIDDGRHDQLLARCPLYQQLARFQLLSA